MKTTQKIRVHKFNFLQFSFLFATIFSCLLLSACATTEVETTLQPHQATFLPKPKEILVYNFAYTPNAVKLNQGLGAKIENHFTETSKTQEELAAAELAADTLSNQLVKDLNALGLPARRAYFGEIPQDNALAITGNFIDIDQGNRLRRVVIGFGAGATHVSTQTQIISYAHKPATMIYAFNTVAKSSKKPGMAPFVGIGAVTGHILASTVVSGSFAGLSETLSSNIQGDSKRTAHKIVETLTPFFEQQNWIIQHS